MAGKSPGPDALERSARDRLAAYAAPSTTSFYNGTPCLEWSKHRTAQGYGMTSYYGRAYRAHRLAWEFAYGPILAGHQIDHLCRNHSCVNVLHLQPVPSRINTLRGKTLAAANLTKTHCPQGHEYTPANTLMEGRKRRCRTCRHIHERKRRPRKTDRRLPRAQPTEAFW